MTDVEVFSLLLGRVHRAGLHLLELSPGLRWVELRTSSRLLRGMADASPGLLLPDFPAELCMTFDEGLHPARVVLRPAFGDPGLPSLDVFALPLTDASHELLVALVGDGLPVDAALGLLPSLLA